MANVRAFISKSVALLRLYNPAIERRACVKCRFELTRWINEKFAISQGVGAEGDQPGRAARFNEKFAISMDEAPCRLQQAALANLAI
eukprot:2791303-Pleurochrysis_carterae.AAC.5